MNLLGGWMGFDLLELVGAKLLVYYLPYYLVGRHAGHD